MSTTTVFAELVIGGLQCLTWITILAMTVFGPSRVTSLVDSSSPSAVVFLLGFSYALGVVFDRVWDTILEVTGLDSRIRTVKEHETEGDRIRRKIYGTDPKNRAAFVDYNRSRMRVARVSLFNFVLITITGLLLITFHFGGVGTKEFLFVLLVGSVLCYATFHAYKDLRRKYDRVLRVVGDTEGPAAPATAEEDVRRANCRAAAQKV